MKLKNREIKAYNNDFYIQDNSLYNKQFAPWECKYFLLVKHDYFGWMHIASVNSKKEALEHIAFVYGHKLKFL